MMCEIVNTDGTVSVRVDENTTLGPFSSRLSAMKKVMEMIIENNRKVDAGLQRLIAEDSSRSTILPPAV